MLHVCMCLNSKLKIQNGLYVLFILIVVEATPAVSLLFPLYTDYKDEICVLCVRDVQSHQFVLIKSVSQ